MATVRLVPTSRYFPLRLRCVKALNKLGQASGTFIPVAPLLLEVLLWPGLTKAAKSGGKPLSDAVPQLRAGKQVLESMAYQQALVDEVSSLHLPCQSLQLQPLALQALKWTTLLALIRQSLCRLIRIVSIGLFTPV